MAVPRDITAVYAGRGGALGVTGRSGGVSPLIVWGLRVFYFGRVTQGVFHCPECGGDRHYSHKIGRRWFTLFFVPVIPLNVVADVVQCGACNTRYTMNVLNVPTSRQLELAYPV